MRVRTYGFPGCFTRPPGTSTRNHPCETTTSKPVVPGVSYCIQSTDPDPVVRASLGGAAPVFANQSELGPETDADSDWFGADRAQRAANHAGG